MKTRIGYIGTGSMGGEHIRTFRDHYADQAQGVAILDPHGPSIDRARKELPDAKVFDDVEALLGSDIDAIVISTPNNTHADYAIAGLAAGKDVLAEKPVATTVEDCRRMVDAAERSDHVIFIGHEYRYSVYFQKIRDLIADGAVGTPQFIWCNEYRGPFMEKVDRWIIDDRRSGGAMVDKNGHHFDVMKWWLGARPKRVTAFGCKKFNNVTGDPDEVIDNAAVSIEFDNGVVGSLNLCMFAPGGGHEHLKLGVIGDGGLLETQLSKDTVSVYPKDKSGEVNRVYHFAEGKSAGHSGFVEEHEAFLDSVTKGVRPLSDVRECADATLLAIAAEQSIRENRAVDVETAP